MAKPQGFRGALFFLLILMATRSLADFDPPPFTRSQLDRLYSGPGDPETRERDLTRLIRARVVRDLRDLYRREAEGGVTTAIAEYTPESGGADLGSGLRVVKCFADGERQTCVNEAWPRFGGQLLLPDELRVRTRVFRSAGRSPGAPGTEFDSVGLRFRVSWTEGEDAELHDEPGFRGSTRLARRVGVSNLDCRSCHRPSFVPSNRRSDERPRDHERLTHESLFSLPAIAQPGLLQLASEFGRPAPTLAALVSPRTLRLPSILPALERIASYRDHYNPLGEDSPVSDTAGNGVYSAGQGHYHEALQELENHDWGRWRYWSANVHAICLTSTCP